ncbi:MAG: hypothetical protein V4519_00340 [Patescibacteria group bacterium]
MFKKGLSTLIIVSIFSMSFAHVGLAQTPPSFSESITLRASPQTPKPGQSVTFTAESFSFDLNTTLITWEVNGVKKLEGIGERYFTLEGQSANSKTIVTVVAGNADASFIIQPSTVDLIWQADSYTPPFFKGKAQFPYQGNVVVTAIPDIRVGNKPVDRKKLVYRWQYDGKLINDASGYGKDTITVTGDIVIKNINISVSVSTSDGSQIATQSLNLTPVQPSVIFYAQSPLYGTLYNRALSTQGSLEQEEISLRAVPYNFSTDFRGGTPTLSFVWSINGTDLNTSESTLLLRRPNGTTSGKTQVGVEVSSIPNILQSESQNILINYETPTQ